MSDVFRARALTGLKVDAMALVFERRGLVKDSRSGRCLFSDAKTRVSYTLETRISKRAPRSNGDGVLGWA